ncbi:hypothetical protein NPIL_581161 [Nephila pilipes]|uniref:Uncharacterized protein n=1 Tax=Nephila pilipes TaxID=299642 RepID=A0A8X6TA32_NEPPI|nr:hypothetical protein NPIL_581161 [Nephila pilipes]
MEEFENKCYETEVKIQNVLDNSSAKANVYTANNDQGFNAVENIQLIKSNSFKKPKHNIESLSGDYKDWPSFKDLYVSLARDKRCLSIIPRKISVSYELFVVRTC